MSVAMSWQQELQEGHRVRTGNPLSKAGEVFSIRAGMEFLNVIPPTPETALLGLVSKYTVGADVQSLKVLAEAARPTGVVLVAEGFPKAALNVGLGGIDLLLDTFAALVEMPKNRLADRPYLESVLRGVLTQGLAFFAWSRLLMAAFDNGDVPVISGTVRDGQTAVENEGYPCNAVALNPTDWQRIEEALPQRMAPVEELAPGVWLPQLGPMWVISTPQQSLGKALVGDLRGLALVTQPEADLSISYSHDQGFVKNEVTLRGELMGQAFVSAPKRLVRVGLPAVP